MQESYKIVRFLGKMCQQCTKCQDGMEKGMLLGDIGQTFLKYEDYFASSCEREYLSLQAEYNQYQRFFDEASEACFECSGQENLIYVHAKALLDSIACKTTAMPATTNVSKLADFPRGKK